MKQNFLLLLLLGLSMGCIFCQSVLIQNINVIDVSAGKLLPGYSVLLTNGMISEVGKTKKIKLPEGATVIDGSGKYLMPGMADAHIHFFQSGGLYTRPDVIDLRSRKSYEKEIAFGKNNVRDYLSRYLRLGITTVADVGSPFANFTVRDSVAGKMDPNVLVTGPLFSMVDRQELGTDKPIVKITSRQAADSLLGAMLPYKPDFIKVWYIAQPGLPAHKNFELVQYIASQTHKHGLKLAVHATERNTAELAVKAGADILVHSVDDSVVTDEFVKLLLEKRVSYIPTLKVSSNYYKVFAGKLPHDAGDLKWANAFSYGSLTDPEALAEEDMPPVLKHMRKKGMPSSLARKDSISNVNLLKLVKAGVNVTAGTDAGNIGTQHASSYLQELQAMHTAGMSKAAILKAATINVAAAFGKENLWGSISKGKKGDLLLLSQNPLDSLHHLQTIEMLFKNGSALQPDSVVKESPEAVVQRQLNAYNARNIDAFMNTYADSVELYEWPNKLFSQGKEKMRQEYAGMFKEIPNLYCEITNRIVNGNTVIDKEKVRVGPNTIEAVAVYEVENGKIKKVSFIQ